MTSLGRHHVTRAFALAYFFHPDRSAALQITARAVAKVRLAERAQARRIEYKPKGRLLRLGAAPRPKRTKISVDRTQLLQRLVLLECDLVDRRQEEEMGSGALSEEAFVLRFVRQLVCSSSRRNSLYVAAALGRILHSYSTAEALELFSIVVQEPDRSPTDSYMRSIKKSLLAELKRRFGDLVRTRSGARGEEMFETIAPSAGVRRLVDSCLERLSPWDTSCPVPHDFDAFGHTLRSLRSADGDTEAEHPVELRRMHSLIHPECFARLTDGLGLRPPTELLSVPRLFKPEGPSREEGSTPDRSQPPPLDDGDVDPIVYLVAREEEPGPSATHVSFRVDGRERARLRLEVGSRARFDVDAENGVLELFAIPPEGGVPLALHLLGREPLVGEPADEELAIAVGGRRTVKVLLRRSRETADTVLPERVEAECVSTDLLGRIRRDRPAGGRSGLGWWAGAVPALALLLAFALLQVDRRGSPRQGEPRADVVLPAASPADGTRGTGSSGPVPLRSATSIYVATPTGPDAAAVARLLADRLRATGRFRVVDDPDAADLALEGSLAIRDAGPAPTLRRTFRLELRLEDAGGRRVWSVSESDSSWEAAVERAVADLLHHAS